MALLLPQPHPGSRHGPQQPYQGSVYEGNRLVLRMAQLPCSARVQRQVLHPASSIAAAHARLLLLRSPRAGTGLTAASRHPVVPGGMEPRWKERPWMWRTVVGVAAVAAFQANLHRSTFSVLLPQMGLGSVHAGLLQSGMLVGYLVAQLPSGHLADQHGGACVLMSALAVWSVATLWTGWAITGGPAALPSLAAARGLLGLATAALMPAVAALSQEWVPSRHRSSSVALIYASNSLGAVVGLGAVPLLAECAGPAAACAVAGILGLAWAGLGTGVLWKLGGRPGQVRPVAVVAVAGAAKQSPARRRRSSHILLPGRSLVQIATLCWAHGVIGWGYFIMASWLPLYCSSLDTSASLTSTGALSSVPWLAACVVGMLVGRAADWLVARGVPALTVRRLLHTISCVGCAASVMPLALTPEPSVALAVACLTSMLSFYAFSYGGFHSYLQQVAVGSVGLLQGVTNSCSVLMGILGTTATGLVVELTGSYTAVFALTAALYMSSSLAFNLLDGRPIHITATGSGSRPAPNRKSAPPGAWPAPGRT